MMKNLFILFLKTLLLEAELFIHTHNPHSFSPFFYETGSPYYHSKYQLYEII